MRFAVARQGSFADLAQAAITAHRQSVGRAIGKGGQQLKQELRDETAQYGLGSRLAGTWQLRVYGAGGKNPAALVYTKAAKIIDSYARGATIYPKSGHRFLAIPTDDAPRKRQGNAMSPDEVEARFGRSLVFIGPGDRGFRTPSIRKNGVAFLVMNGLVTRKSTARWRGATANELAGKTRNPRPVQSVIMFILVPFVKKPKLFDLDRLAADAGANVTLLIAGGNA